MAADPIHQFEITKLFTIGHIGGHEIAFTNSSAYMFLSVAVISLLMLGTGRQLIPGRMQSVAELSYEFVASTMQKQRRLGRHEVLPAGVLAVHVHRSLEPDRDHSLHLHGFEPHHRHRGAGAAGVLHRAVLRLLQERPEILQAVRAVGRADLHPAAGGVHRGHLVLPEAGFAFGATVRQHAGGPHRAEGVRELRRHARRHRLHWLDRRRFCRWD